MNYKLSELVILFFVYSFLGWVIETGVATIKSKKYRNRGLLSGPLCLIYGFSGICMTVFLWELKESPVFLFLGATIVATVIEWFTGKVLERINQERWWDYSEKKWNIDGYICLQYSVLWGMLGCSILYLGNDLVIGLFSLLPKFLIQILLWIFGIICILDILASALTITYQEERFAGLLRWNQKLERWTTRFGRRIAGRIQIRIEKAYPAVHIEGKKAKSGERLCVSEFFWLFAIGALLGDIVETIYCRITAGVWMSRSSLVWGPFSIVWGLALALVTALLYKDKDKPDRYLFAAGTILGGAYEYMCSVFTEIVFGKVFWDYSAIPFNLGGRINLLYCFFWGIAAVVWFRVGYPRLHTLIRWLMQKTGRGLTIFMLLFMVANISVSILALIRYDTRGQGIEAGQQWERIMDERFPDERMKRIYPNAQ